MLSADSLAADPFAPRKPVEELTPTAVWALALSSYIGLALGLTGFVLDVMPLIATGILLVFPGSIAVRAGLRKAGRVRVHVDEGEAPPCALSLR